VEVKYQKKAVRLGFAGSPCRRVWIGQTLEKKLFIPGNHRSVLKPEP